ncbi:MAG: hypothetical protein ABIJ36_00445 [Patescibacteria group bacterium]|nr:hypothetical protein [Patescibacteria group bacterium]
MKKITILLPLIMPVLIAILAQALLVNGFCLSGKDISDLEYKKNMLVKENAELKQQSSYYSSLNYVKNEAQRDGLVVLSMEFLEAPSLAVR